MAIILREAPKPKLLIFSSLQQPIKSTCAAIRQNKQPWKEHKERQADSGPTFTASSGTLNFGCSLAQSIRRPSCRVCRRWRACRPQETDEWKHCSVHPQYPRWKMIAAPTVAGETREVVRSYKCLTSPRTPWTTVEKTPAVQLGDYLRGSVGPLAQHIGKDTHSAIPRPELGIWLQIN